MYTFDGQNRIISLDLGVVELEVIDMYSRWKEWVSIGENAKFSNAFSVIGGEPINTDGSQVISPYFFFINGWKLRPQEANHQLTINGNLLSLDGTQPTIPTLGGYEVFVRTILSVNSTSISTGVGSLDLQPVIDNQNIINENVKKASILVPATTDTNP